MTGKRLFRGLAALACTTMFSALSLPPAFSQPATFAAPQSERAHAIDFQFEVAIDANGSAEVTETRRINILNEGMLGSVGQQQRIHVDRMQKLEIVKAFTLKADGREIPVPTSSIITGDASSTEGVYTRDQKSTIVIFPDLAVGDSIVLTTRLTHLADMIKGHFSETFIFPRHIPIGPSSIRISAPKGLPLNVATRGPGFEVRIREEGAQQIHTIAHRPPPRAAEENGAVAALDRDPVAFVSTFQDYGTLGESYWREARDKVAATPEIVALAEQITQGLTDRRAKAEAISSWVKRNIRYVALYLGPGRFISNSAEAVLASKYGDCKDHVALMMALLSAVGIESEQVLIHASNSYQLPTTPVLSAFNHVIISVPEFGIYDDPTVALSGFGVLNAATYDKAVLRVSDRGAQLDRTPAMVADDHVSLNRTRLNIAADGGVSGETQQIAKGVFATNARYVAMQIMQMGTEAAGEKQLKALGVPGRGRFEVPRLTNSDSYAVSATFALARRWRVPLSGSFEIPVGMPIQSRPGDVLFGPRQEDRTMPFACFAGRQIEEIAIHFADELTLPKPLNNRRLDTRLFTYTAQYRMENRTLTIRREFVSKVRSQVCDPASERELAKDLAVVNGSLKTRLVFAPPPPAAPPASPPSASTPQGAAQGPSPQSPAPSSTAAPAPDCNINICPRPVTTLRITAESVKAQAALR